MEPFIRVMTQVWWLERVAVFYNICAGVGRVNRQSCRTC